MMDATRTRVPTIRFSLSDVSMIRAMIILVFLTLNVSEAFTATATIATTLQFPNTVSLSAPRSKAKSTCMLVGTVYQSTFSSEYPQQQQPLSTLHPTVSYQQTQMMIPTTIFYFASNDQ